MPPVRESELRELFETITREGFEQMTDRDRRILSGVFVRATIRNQEGLDQLIGAVDHLTRRFEPVAEKVEALDAWMDRNREKVERVLQDAQEHHEGANKVKWGAAQWVVILLLAGALSLALDWIQDARSAPRSGVGVGPGRLPTHFEEEVDEGEPDQEEGDQEVGASSVLGWDAGVLGRAGLPLSYPRDQFGLAAKDLGGLAVEPPLARPAFGGVHQPQPLLYVSGLTDDPRHLLEEPRRGGVGEQRPVGERRAESGDRAGGIGKLPAEERASGEQEGGDGIGVGEPLALEYAVLHGAQVGYDARVVRSEPLAGHGIGGGVLPGADEGFDGPGRAPHGVALGLGEAGVLGARGEERADGQES